MTIIDLGELTGTDFEPPRPPARVLRRLLRPAALVVAALLALVTVTASARTPPPRGVRTLWSAPLSDTDSLYLSGETVFLNRLDENQVRATLTAYDAATGAERWSAPAGTYGGYPDQVTSAGVVLQPTATAQLRSGETTNAWTRTTTALDEATGTRLWQLDAATAQIGRDTVLLSEHDARGRVTRLRLVRQRDGGTIWSRAVAAGSAVVASDDAVVTVDGHGLVAVLGRADGSVARTRRVPWVPDRPEEGRSNSLGLVGGALILDRSTQSTTTATVYRLDTLAEIWHADGYVGDCEPVLCSTEGDTVVGRDPGTGAERWRLPGITNVFGIGPGRMLADSVRDDTGFALIDSRTARTVADLGPGQLPWSGGTGSPLLLLRTVVEPPHTTVIRIDRATGAEFTLGALERLDDETPNCQAGPRYLICPGRGRFTVTAVG